MPDWREECLGALASIVIGGTPSRDIERYWAEKDEPGFPWASISDLGPRVVYETKEQITELGVRNSNVKMVPAGTLMMSFKLTIGRVGIAGRDLYTNEAIASFVPLKGKIDGRYLYYVLPEAAREAITDTAIKGATLNKQKLRDLELRFPADLDVQSRIAEILSTVDEAIEQTEALIAKTQQLKAGLIHDLFTRGVTPDGQLRPTREEAPQLYKQSPLGWIPNEWDVEGLDAYLDPVSGVKPGPFGSSLTKDVFVQEGYRVYGQEQVIAGTLAEGDYYISEAKFAEMRAFEVLAGDVLLSLVGTVGRVLIVEDPYEAGIINPRLMRLRPDPNIASSQFLRFLLLTNSIKRQTEMLAGGGTMPVINGKVIRRLQAPKISPREQELIVERLSALEAEVASSEAELDKLKLVKAGLMGDLLSGCVQISA